MDGRQFINIDTDLLHDIFRLCAVRCQTHRDEFSYIPHFIRSKSGLFRDFESWQRCHSADCFDAFHVGGNRDLRAQVLRNVEAADVAMSDGAAQKRNFFHTCKLDIADIATATT